MKRVKLSAVSTSGHVAVAAGRRPVPLPRYQRGFPKSGQWHSLRKQNGPASTGPYP